MSAEKVAFDFAFELRDRFMAPVAFDKTYFSLETFHESGYNDSDGVIVNSLVPIENAFSSCNYTNQSKRPFSQASDDDFQNDLSNQYVLCLNTSQVVFRNNFNYYSGF